MLSRLRKNAWLWWLHNPTLQAYNDAQEDNGFEDFAVDLICSIARFEFWKETERFTSKTDFENYVSEWFDFDLINPEEIIKEYEREERQ